MRDDEQKRIEHATGSAVVRAERLSGGCVGDVRCVTLEDGQRLVAKLGGPGARLDIEGDMLRLLRERSALPVPDVLHDEPTLMLIEWIEHDGAGGPDAERHAAEQLAALHDLAPTMGDGAGRSYGLHFDTLIGGLEQANGWMESWPRFYAERRLLPMASAAARTGGLSRAGERAVGRLASRIDEVLAIDARAPGLIHGDVWSGNVLLHRGRVAAYIDPACHYADPEVELAFITMFSTFGRAFFERYNELRPIARGFWEQRREAYLLYPLLVHARLFGGGYGREAETILSRLGFGNG